jgi:heat shock protein HslJ
MKKNLLIIILFCAFLGCKQEKKSDKIEITPQNASVEQFGYTQLKAKVIYDNNSVDSISTVAWKSADTSIATIDAKGLLKGIDTGKVVISATYGNIKGQIEVIVVQNRLFKNSWTLTSIQDINTDSVIYFPDDAPHNIIITFLFGRMTSTDSIHLILGFSGICNTGGGDCFIDGNRISFPKGISDTRVDCKYAEWEIYLQENLRKAFEYEIVVNQLQIKSKYKYNLYFEKTL